MTVRAIIDVGTNSTKMLVVDGGTDVLRNLTPARLGEGLASTGRMSDDAMSRTLEVIDGFSGRARELGATDITIVGTAACRRASNTTSFAAMVRERTGCDLNVISGETEAELSFIGALRNLPAVAGNTLVVDIGGGSTELTVGTDQPHRALSIPIGAVTATESDLTTDPPRPEDLTNVIGAVQDELEEIGRLHPEMVTSRRVVGIAGTIVKIGRAHV